MNAEHLLQGTEPLLRAAVFLAGLVVGTSMWARAHAIGLRIEVCGVRCVEVGGYEMDESM